MPYGALNEAAGSRRSPPIPVPIAIAFEAAVLP
jgi:hypothetical protein